MLAVALAACSPQPGADSGALDSAIEDTGAMDSATAEDASVDTGALQDVASERPFVPSGCPAPAVIAPTATFTGFLPPVNAEYVRTVDGDTAHFLVAGVEITVRIMYVNAEETSGAEATAFGRATVPLVSQMLRGARLQLVQQRGANGMPNLDGFGRTLAMVFTDGELLETRVIREGLSAYYTQFGCAPAPAHLALLYAEAEARANQRGIWAPGHPTNYAEVLSRWIGRSTCRPNPFMGQPYCR